METSSLVGLKCNKGFIGFSTSLTTSYWKTLDFQYHTSVMTWWVYSQLTAVMDSPLAFTCLSASSRCSLLEVELLSSSSELWISSSSSEWTSWLSQPLLEETQRPHIQHEAQGQRDRENKADFSFFFSQGGMFGCVKETQDRSMSLCSETPSLDKYRLKHVSRGWIQHTVTHYTTKTHSYVFYTVGNTDYSSRRRSKVQCFQQRCLTF